MQEVTIQALKDGPFLVKGSAKLLDANGKEILTKEPTLALCRCGDSASKPFCDGSHQKSNFHG